MASQQLDSVSQRAAAEQWSYTHFLGYLLDGELQARHHKCVELNLKFAKFPYLKRLEDFDFAAQPGLDRRLIDEVGYLTLDPLQSSLLFQVICQRYQRQQPIVLTSNKAFSDWGQVFADDAVLASAALDRLLHRSTIINIRGESYRLKEKRQAGQAPMTDNRKGGAT